MRSRLVAFVRSALTLVLLLLVLLWTALAQAGVKVSTASGNASAGGTWVGGVAPTTGDQIVIASGHAVTIDANLDVGVSPPSTPITTLTFSASGGASFTSLPTATTGYRYTYTYVDAGGNESAQVIQDQGTGAITNGVSKPQVTFPAMPSGIASRNLYLSDTNGASGTGHLYASGITTLTYDLVSASYQNGTMAYGAAPAIPNKVAVTVNGTGSLTIGTGVTLTCRGDFWLANAQVTFNGGAILEFNPASANSPTTAGYYLWGGSAATQTAVKILTSGTSSGSRAQIRTAAGSYKAARIIPWVFAFGTVADSLWFNVSYMTFSRLGDSTTNHAITINPSASSVVTVFDHCIFDTCARVYFSGNSPATGGWNITYCSWKNSVSGTNPLLVNAVASLTTGTRTVDHCVFDLAPSLSTKDTTYTNNYFDAEFVLNGTTAKWASFDSNFVRNIFDTNGSGGFPTAGDVTNCIVMGDTAPTATVSGTATSGTSTTLVDSTKTWTTNAYQSGGGPSSGWGVYITGGTGSGQGRNIASNTATTLTVNRAWDTTPDATSTYRIYQAGGNPHYIASTSAPASSSINLTGNIVQGVLFDNNGDVFLHMDLASAVYNVSSNIVLPNVARDNTGTLMTVGTTDNTATYTFNHNTYFTGAQSAAVNEGAATFTVTSATTTVLTVASTSGVVDGDLIKFTPTTTTTALRNVTATASSHTTTTITLSSALPTTPAAGDVFAYTIQPGRITSFKSNIAWCETGKSYVLGGGGSTLGPWKLVSSSFIGATRGYDTLDIVTLTTGASNADYNCGYGHKTNGYSDTQNAGGGGGYDLNSSVAMGSHDINVDPQFVDPWRSIWGWAQSLGSTGDPFDLVKDMRAKMKAINDPSDASYNASYNFAALRTYLIAGMAIQNAALHNTGHDSTDIGAVSYVSAANPVPVINGGFRRRVSRPSRPELPIPLRPRPRRKAA